MSHPTPSANPHEPHGTCTTCYMGVHRYTRDDPGAPWQHVNLARHAHQPTVRVTCCAAHTAEADR